jgi:hypothetical protein
VRYLVGFVFVLALSVVGCSETDCLAVVDCPAEVPNEGAACSPGVCLYRDSINIDNQTVAVCKPNGWSVRVETGEGECPATQPVSGEACDGATVQTAACYYDPMVCYCYEGTNGFWRCYRLLREGCPPQPPVDGMCCNVDDGDWLACQYWPCDLNHPVGDVHHCIDGIWSSPDHSDCAP